MTGVPADSWWRFRRARRLQWYGMALFGLAALLVLLDNFGPPIGWDYAIGPVMMTAVVLWIVGAWRHGRLSCPHCGARFFSRRTRWGGTFSNPWARRCLNCGLPLWTTRQQCISEAEHSKEMK